MCILIHQKIAASRKYEHAPRLSAHLIELPIIDRIDPQKKS